MKSGSEGVSSFLKREVQHRWPRWCGFAMLLIWIYCMFWSGFLRESTDSVYLLMRSVWLGAEAAGFLLAFVLLGKYKNFLKRRTSLFISAILVMSSSMGMMLSCLYCVEVLPCGIFSAISGLGSALLLAAWGVAMSREGAQSLLIDIGISLIMASLVDTALNMAPLALQCAAIVFSPIICGGLAVFEQKRFDVKDNIAANSKSQKLGNSRSSKLWRIFLLPMLAGVSYGLIQRLTLAGNNEIVSSLSGLIITGAFGISGMLILVAALLIKQGRILQLIYFLALPVMVTAFVLLPIFSDFRAAIQAAYIVGFNYFYFLTWAFWLGSWELFNLELSRRFAVGLFVFTLSESVGNLIGIEIIKISEINGNAIAVICMVVVYLFMMGALFSVGDLFKSHKHFRGFNSLEEQESETFNLFDDALAEDYSLSSRECEVLNLLVRGRNRAYISKKLYISDNTTRTHMRHIYAKLDVHSHQELLDLVEQRLTR